MLQAEFTLYRFVCDLETFTGLFADDSDGRHIPDTAAFSCAWARVARTKIATLNPVQVEPTGTTSSTYFKSLNSDMALTFPLDPVTLRMNGDKEVLTFQIRPTQYTGGDIPVVAKGTLDPAPYFGKPKKNYAVKLRDASSQAIGKLIFCLTVTEVDADDTEEVRRALRESQSAVRASQSQTPSRPPPPRSSTGSRNPSADFGSPSRVTEKAVNERTPSSPPPGVHTLEKTPPRELALHGPQHSGSVDGHSPLPTEPPTQQKTATPHQETRIHKPPTQTAITGRETAAGKSPPRRKAAPAAVMGPQATTTTSTAPVIDCLNIVFERVAVKPEEVTLSRPAPFLIGGSYTLKLRHGTTSHSTVNMTCTRGSAIPLLDQQTRLPLLAGSSEKLRFSLWENGKQVAGFSLSPDKFRNDVGQSKPYTIPFRYHPTNQTCTLEVTVTRLETSLDTAPQTAAPEQPTQTSAPVPSPLTGASQPSVVATMGGAPPPVVKTSPVKVLHRWAPNSDTAQSSTTAASGAISSSNRQETEAAPKRAVSSADRERSGSSPAPHPVRAQRGVRSDGAPQPRRMPAAPPGEPQSRHIADRSDGPRHRRGGSPPSVADTAMELRVVEVEPIDAPLRRQSFVPSLAGPGMWAAHGALANAGPHSATSGGGGGGGGTPLRQRTVMTENTSVAFPVENLEVPRIIPETRRAHSRDPSSTALGLPSEPQHADPFTQGRSTPVRSFLPRTSSSRNSSVNATPVSRGWADAPRSHGAASADEPEQRMSAVIARLDAMREGRNKTPLFDPSPAAQSSSGQPGGRMSLATEWQQWRNSRPSSRSGSVMSLHDPHRAPSVTSAMSRDDSVASVSSRRCSPLPTKSFAKHAEQRPVQTVADDDALTHYRRHRGNTK